MNTNSLRNMMQDSHRRPCRYVEGNLNTNNVLVKVVHLHSGNASNKERGRKKFVTVAKLFDKNTRELLGSGKAYCCDRDAPRREVGRTVAIGRAIKEAVEINCVDENRIFDLK